ncbi:cyclic nucleotide-binding domain-containing protein [Ophiocordyceps camponoti-floridani]|uniref:Cyclic nucleotide-binding domain-containing protein n=1 Tax=Ophiocordyceps camponoti-floridani TaxID=2030778 RepID=A0A8H4QDA3_9HYPO|nr:cyclic nucleotide-binding domain-containing protein [Ophiocordyceps camponoti-floridani]
MRRGRSAGAASPYRALAHHHHNQQQQVPSDSTLIRSFDVDANPARPVRPSPLATSVIRDMPLDLVDRIRSFPLFQSAPGDFLIAIGNHLKPQIHAPNDHVVTEGDDARAMYWLVRGVVAVTSRDGEAVYAELKPGAFFGEIGVLMNMPRTATIVARTKCLLLVLKKEDLQLVLPRFPDMEQAILEEAQERLSLLKKKKRIERPAAQSCPPKWPVAAEAGGSESGAILDGAVVKNPKKRKSPSPGIIQDPASGGSAIGSGLVSIRKTLKELPLFSTLPPDILHFLGLSVAPKSFPPFTDIIRQGSSGNEIYFIVQGEAEVVYRDQPERTQDDAAAISPIQPRPRLRAGQYFGEVASLGLSPGRTATVRSITTVECLVVPGETLEELWRRCPPSIRSQVEETARERYSEVRQSDGPWDIDMADTAKAADADSGLSDTPKTPPKTPSPAKGRGYVAASMFTVPSSPRPSSPISKDDQADMMMGPRDPDPFRSVDMENLRNRRRQSLVPLTTTTTTTMTTMTTTTTAPLTESPTSTASGRPNGGVSRPLRVLTADATSQPTKAEESSPDGGPAAARVKRAKTLPSQEQSRDESCEGECSAAAVVAARSDDVLVRIFSHLDVGHLVRLRIVSRRWRQILETSPLVCNDVDLSGYSRRVNDDVIVSVIGPFIGTRAESVDLNGCYHISDRGFSALWSSCGKNVKRWKMRSVWDVSATQILEMSVNAKSLEELDWSNCRKVGDNLLARVVGWVVIPKKENAAQQLLPNQASQPWDGKKKAGIKTRSRTPDAPARGLEDDGDGEPKTGSAEAPSNMVIGCPRLSKLDLSYCKHVTDRSMAHLAAHASNRLRWLSLTRCTSITDAGFQAWAHHKFERLTHLYLADCTYLSDSAIVSLASAAKQLTHLDLSFCCALSDTATEVLALRLPKLRELRLAFCGSAVSDMSLQSIALHLGQLEGLSVRGCVRVTGRGLESVLEGCARLVWVDVSQCRNLEAWLRSGSVAKWGFDDRAKKPPPPQSPQIASGDQRMGGQGADVPLHTPLSVATMLATPGFFPRSHLGGFFLGRRVKRQPVRFIVQKSMQGLR